MSDRAEPLSTQLGSPFDCQECGKSVMAQEFHDYVECIRQRHRTNQITRPYSDIQSLLYVIDKLEPERRGLMRGPENGPKATPLPSSPFTIEEALANAIKFQDAKYSPFAATTPSVRLAIACLEDEIAEVRQSWREARRPGKDRFVHVREEAIQVAAIAFRLVRDAGNG